MKSVVIAAFVAELASPLSARAQTADAGLATQPTRTTSRASLGRSVAILRKTLRLLSGAPATPRAPSPPQPPRPPQPPFAVGTTGSSRAVEVVKGAVVVEVSVVHGDIEVARGAKGKVTISVNKSRTGAVRIDKAGGNRMTALFGHSPVLVDGDVTLEVPPGSSVVLQAVNGDVTVDNIGGDATVSAVAGDIEVDGANEVSIESVSGDVELDAIAGAVNLETVSGDARVVTVPKPASRLRFETTSGDLAWFGMCGKGCRLRADTLSGDVKFVVAKKSKFVVTLTTFSGDLQSAVNLVMSGARGRSSKVSGRYGTGDGAIDCTTHSGDVYVSHSE